MLKNVQKDNKLKQKSYFCILLYNLQSRPYAVDRNQLFKREEEKTHLKTYFSLSNQRFNLL